MFVPAFFGLLLAALVSGQVRIEPTEVVSRIGDSVDVMCKVHYPIDSCRMNVGGISYRLKPELLEGPVIYQGPGGLAAGECGGHIRSVDENMNGNVTCFVPAQSGPVELQASMKLIVAKAPEQPLLISPAEALFQEGEILNVQCLSARGRPAAKITWFLQDAEDKEEQIFTGVHQPVITMEGTLQTISVNLTRKLSAEDGGKKLVCKADHQALLAPGQASKQLIVNYPPRRADSTDSQITIFGLKLGAEGRLNVTVRASPPPRAHWTVSGHQLTAPASFEEITALEPVTLGNGYYNVTLVLNRVEKPDVERAYYLRVQNTLGEADFVLRISTMDEPAGVELDTGAVVGIVIAALVLLIAVSLLVFAKATDRWCFAGSRSRDPAKSSGESSDTESAAGGRRREARGGRVGAAAQDAWERARAFVTKRRDKVQASEQEPADEERPAEKEGVVYADLDLPQTGRDSERTAPPSSEYAEIIPGSSPGAVEGQKETKQ